MQEVVQSGVVLFGFGLDDGETVLHELIGAFLGLESILLRLEHVELLNFLRDHHLVELAGVLNVELVVVEGENFGHEQVSALIVVPHGFTGGEVKDDVVLHFDGGDVDEGVQDVEVEVLDDVEVLRGEVPFDHEDFDDLEKHAVNVLVDDLLLPDFLLVRNQLVVVLDLCTHHLDVLRVVRQVVFGEIGDFDDDLLVVYFALDVQVHVEEEQEQPLPHGPAKLRQFQQLLQIRDGKVALALAFSGRVFLFCAHRQDLHLRAEVVQLVGDLDFLDDSGGCRGS